MELRRNGAGRRSCRAGAAAAKAVAAAASAATAAASAAAVTALDAEDGTDSLRDAASDALAPMVPRGQDSDWLRSRRAF